jgi:hypothetical protein
LSKKPPVPTSTNLRSERAESSRHRGKSARMRLSRSPERAIEQSEDVNDPG